MSQVGAGQAGMPSSRYGQGMPSETQGVVDQVQEKAGEAMDQAQTKLGEVAATAREQASQRLSGQIETMAASLGSVVSAVHAVGRELRDKDERQLASFADRAADQVDRFAGYLRGKDLGTVVEDVEAFARRQPAMFLGSALALGLIASRFMKSSAPSVGAQGNAWSYRPYGAYSSGQTRPLALPTPRSAPYRRTYGAPYGAGQGRPLNRSGYGSPQPWGGARPYAAPTQPGDTRPAGAQPPSPAGSITATPPSGSGMTGVTPSSSASSSASPVRQAPTNTASPPSSASGNTGTSATGDSERAAA